MFATIGASSNRSPDCFCYVPASCNSNRNKVHIADIPTPLPRPSVITCVCQRLKDTDFSTVGANNMELKAIIMMNATTAD